MKPILILLFFIVTHAFSYNGNKNSDFFIPYKKNYFQPIAYDFASHDDSRKDYEAKYQLSFKIPFLEGDTEIAMGYTQKAYWQVYNNDDTRPFREIAHNPDMFANLKLEEGIFLGLKRVKFGYEHDSNGKGLYENSLAWNRLFTTGFWQKEKLLIDLKLWYWLKKPAKEDEDDPSGDETPYIEDYFGYFELHLTYPFEKFRSEITLRNNLDSSENRGALNLELYGPFEKYNWYVTYFYGYGESLMDYRDLSNKLGVGFLFTY